MPRYRISYLGSDGTGEVELVFFEKAGKELIGKTALGLIRSKVPHGIPLKEVIQFARSDQSTPREIAAVVAKKFRLVVSVTNNSFKPESEKPSICSMGDSHRPPMPVLNLAWHWPHAASLLIVV